MSEYGLRCAQLYYALDVHRKEEQRGQAAQKKQLKGLVYTVFGNQAVLQDQDELIASNLRHWHNALGIASTQLRTWKIVMHQQEESWISRPLVSYYANGPTACRCWSKVRVAARQD